MYQLVIFDTFHKHRGKLLEREMQAAAGLKDPKRGFPQEVGVILECNP